MIAAEQLCFIGEKSLRGAELFNGKDQSDPITGVPPYHMVNPDFRKTYCIMGICLANRDKVRLFVYNIGEYIEVGAKC